jgi:hypothetical protein
MIDICDAIETLRPGAGYVLTGTDITGITWVTENVAPLTQKEIDAEIVKLGRQAVTDENARQVATAAAIAHAKSLGFTDAMIGVMYPGLVKADISPTEPEPTFADLTKRDEPPIVDP